MKHAVSANWRATLLVCRKCSKRLGGGFGPKGTLSLAKALKAETGGGKRRKAPLGIVEVKCLGVCPRAAVTMIDTRRSDSWMLVPRGADIAKLAGQLGLDQA